MTKEILTAIVYAAVALMFAMILTLMTGFNCVLVMVLGTAGWCAWDSKEIGLRGYKSGIAYSPWVLFVAISLVWCAGFPWYLVVRARVLRGLVPRADSSAAA